MPRNGSGTYSLPQAPFVSGTTISSSAVNSDLSDIGGALTQSISKDGQTPYTANQPMGGNKFTGLGLGTAVGDSANYEQLGQSVSTLTGALDTGATAIPFDDTIPQITEGKEFLSRAITPRSATSTLYITITVALACNVADDVTVALFQDATAGALKAVSAFQTTVDQPMVITFTHVMTSGTVAATTFTVRIGSNGGNTITLNGTAGVRRLGGVMGSGIVIRESLT